MYFPAGRLAGIFTTSRTEYPLQSTPSHPSHGGGKGGPENGAKCEGGGRVEREAPRVSTSWTGRGHGSPPTLRAVGAPQILHRGRLADLVPVGLDRTDLVAARAVRARRAWALCAIARLSALAAPDVIVAGHAVVRRCVCVVGALEAARPQQSRRHWHQRPGAPSRLRPNADKRALARGQLLRCAVGKDNRLLVLHKVERVLLEAFLRQVGKVRRRRAKPVLVCTQTPEARGGRREGQPA